MGLMLWPFPERLLPAGRCSKHFTNTRCSQQPQRRMKHRQLREGCAREEQQDSVFQPPAWLSGQERSQSARVREEIQGHLRHAGLGEDARDKGQ